MHFCSEILKDSATGDGYTFAEFGAVGLAMEPRQRKTRAGAAKHNNELTSISFCARWAICHPEWLTLCVGLSCHVRA